ncbi:hypothetical protein COO60DRAFT_221449 [Scenedesmus sp. NREL 46B-D3]|nr:hypothetical protein COO60DRAFT_221449 [Scenedesmus sp. NREL 46B-D3]
MPAVLCRTPGPAASREGATANAAAAAAAAKSGSFAKQRGSRELHALLQGIPAARGNAPLSHSLRAAAAVAAGAATPAAKASPPTLAVGCASNAARVRVKRSASRELKVLLKEASAAGLGRKPTAAAAVAVTAGGSPGARPPAAGRATAAARVAATAAAAGNSNLRRSGNEYKLLMQEPQQRRGTGGSNAKAAAAFSGPGARAAAACAGAAGVQHATTKTMPRPFAATFGRPASITTLGSAAPAGGGAAAGGGGLKHARARQLQQDAVAAAKRRKFASNREASTAAAAAAVQQQQRQQVSVGLVEQRLLDLLYIKQEQELLGSGPEAHEQQRQHSRIEEQQLLDLLHLKDEQQQQQQQQQRGSHLTQQAQLGCSGAAQLLPHQSDPSQPLSQEMPHHQQEQQQVPSAEAGAVGTEAAAAAGKARAAARPTADGAVVVPADAAAAMPAQGGERGSKGASFYRAVDGSRIWVKSQKLGVNSSNVTISRQFCSLELGMPLPAGSSAAIVKPVEALVVRDGVQQPGSQPCAIRLTGPGGNSYITMRTEGGRTGTLKHYMGCNAVGIAKHSATCIKLYFETDQLQQQWRPGITLPKPAAADQQARLASPTRALAAAAAAAAGGGAQAAPDTSTGDTGGAVDAAGGAAAALPVVATRGRGRARSSGSMHGRGSGGGEVGSSAARAEGGLQQQHQQQQQQQLSTDLLLQLLPEVPAEGLQGMAAAVAHVAAQLKSRVGAAQVDAVQEVFRSAAAGAAAASADMKSTRPEAAPPAAGGETAGTAVDTAAAQAAGDEVPQQEQQQGGQADGLPAAAAAAATVGVTGLQLQMLYGWLRLWCKRGNQEQMAAVLKAMAQLCSQPAATAVLVAAADTL